jgi:branched-chain amino acid transport system substrate-binding protein
MRGTTCGRLLAAALCSCMLFVTACGGSDEAASGGGSSEATNGAAAAQNSSGPITIGVTGARSGFMSAFDIPFGVGVDLAVADLNAKGGVLGRKLQTVVCDSKTEIAQSATCGAEVLGKGAAVQLTSCDYDFGGPAARVADQKGIISLACAASPKYGKQGIGPNAFSIAAGTPTEGAVMAEYAYKKLGKRSAYLLRDTGLEYSKAFCQYFEARFKELGGKIVGRDDFANDDQSIASQIGNLRGANPKPDVIGYCSFAPGGAAGLRQIRGAGIDLPIVADTAFDGNFWLKAVPNLSDFYYPTPGSIFGDDEDQKWQDFVQKYVEKAGDQPASANYPGSGYTAVQLWAAAVEKAKTLDTTKVRPILESFKDEDALNGPTTFGPDQHMALGRPMAVMEVRNGKNRFVERYAPEKVPQPQY